MMAYTGCTPIWNCCLVLNMKDPAAYRYGNLPDTIYTQHITSSLQTELRCYLSLLTVNTTYQFPYNAQKLRVHMQCISTPFKLIPRLSTHIERMHSGRHLPTHAYGATTAQPCLPPRPVILVHGVWMARFLSCEEMQSCVSILGKRTGFGGGFSRWPEIHSTTGP